jgi:hypothetical protein
VDGGGDAAPLDRALALSLPEGSGDAPDSVALGDAGSGDADGSGEVDGSGDVDGGADEAGGAEADGAADCDGAVVLGTVGGGASGGAGMIRGPGTGLVVAGMTGAFVCSTTGTALGSAGVGVNETCDCAGSPAGTSAAVSARPAADSAPGAEAGTPGSGSSVRGAIGVAPDRLSPNAPV